MSYNISAVFGVETLVYLQATSPPPTTNKLQNTCTSLKLRKLSKLWKIVPQSVDSNIKPYSGLIKNSHKEDVFKTKKTCKNKTILKGPCQRNSYHSVT